jgi:hypothetical protein
VKTTVDIPDVLYRRAKIRAVESGRTLRQVVLDALAASLEGSSGVWPARVPTFGETRDLLPEFEAAMAGGGLFAGPPDSADIVAEDRSSRDDALL